jgi:hypothetical protein
MQKTSLLHVIAGDQAFTCPSHSKCPNKFSKLPLVQSKGFCFIMSQGGDPCDTCSASGGC